MEKEVYQLAIGREKQSRNNKRQGNDKQIKIIFKKIIK